MRLTAHGKLMSVSRRHSDNFYGAFGMASDGFRHAAPWHIALLVFRLTALAHMDDGANRRVLYRATKDFVS